MLETLSQYNTVIVETVSAFGMKILGAVALWVIGGMVINTVGNLAERAMSARKVDATLVRYAEAVLRVIMRIALVIAILSVFGIETTSFAALIAAAGVAIGVAWSGLLANFASGIFLMILRPIKVGDTITAGGVTGEVTEIGLFATTINTGDNLLVTVGNNKLFSDNIINYNANPHRRVELTAQLAHGVDVHDAIRRYEQALSKIPNVLTTPAPVVDIMEFNHYGTKLVVRPSCQCAHYGQVYSDTNMAIYNVAVEARWPVPAPSK